MKNFLLLFFIVFFFFCCKKEDSLAFDTKEESVKYVLKRFPAISGDFKGIRTISTDSLSITLLRNKNKDDYDEVLVFKKNEKYYSIPFFSNMYFDFWEFQDENQNQLYQKTNSTFNKELKNVIIALNLTDEESILVINELFLSVLRSEINLNLKPMIFENYVYQTERVNKYKIEETEFCTERTKKIFEKIKNDSKEVIRYNQYYLDSTNGRIYEVINTSPQTRKISFEIKTYRIDCFSYPLNI